MKTPVRILIIACFTFVLLFSSCVTESQGTFNEVFQNPRELWGEWIRMDTGNTWLIASNYIETIDTYNTIAMTRQSANVIQVTNRNAQGNTNIFFLYASRIANGTFSGTIAGLAEGTANSNARFSMELLVRNLNDTANSVITNTSENGNFKAEDIIPGDAYEIIVEGHVIPVFPNNSGEDVGTVTVTDGINLVTSIRPQETSILNEHNYDMMRLYPDEDYRLAVVVRNVGEENASAVEFTITMPDGLTLVSLENNSDSNMITANTGILFTITPGNERRIFITVRCDAWDNGDEYRFKNIQIDTRDASGKTWSDSVSLKFNKEWVDFYIRATSDRLNGVVIVPNVRAYHFNTSTPDCAFTFTTSIRVPKYSGDYLIVFSGATPGTEAVYSFMAGSMPDNNFADLDITKYFLNSSENNAAIVSPDDKTIYLLETNRITYFKVTFK
jgi:uncharacterized repeat protein (TIGR01451 family)